VGRLCTRGKYLEIKENAHELPYSISTFLLGKSKSAGLKKEEDRGEGELRVLNKIISSAASAVNLSISKFKIFFNSRSPIKRKRF
jgi:hypothetical protein